MRTPSVPGPDLAVYHNFMNRRLLILVLLSTVAMASMPLGGCYYMQAVGGQLELMRKREPIADVLDDPRLAVDLRRKLELVLDARRFASRELDLPENDSYLSYADLERDYVVWNVFAAREFDLSPVSWCFPVVGCVAYRGYFREDAARKYAAKLSEDGYDVRVTGVPAYSTLGRFADPVLNTMLGWSDAGLLSTLFHELAHQRLFVKGDTAFNESFATAVAEVGLNRWLEERPGSIDLERHGAGLEYRKALMQLAERAKEDLEGIYTSDATPASKRQQKAERFARLTEEAGILARERGYANSGWLQGPLNNAALLPVALYRGRIDAFRALLDYCNEDLACFYDEAERLGRLDAPTRHAALDELEYTSMAGRVPPAGGDAE